MSKLEEVILKHTNAAVEVAELIHRRLFVNTDEEADEISRQIETLKHEIESLRKRRVEILGK